MSQVKLMRVLRCFVTFKRAVAFTLSAAQTMGIDVTMSTPVAAAALYLDHQLQLNCADDIIFVMSVCMLHVRSRPKSAVELCQ
jgi:hypothetical protein